MKTVRVWKNLLFFAVIPAILTAGCSVWAQTEIDNPIKAKNFLDLVNAIADAVIKIAAPVAVIAIIIVGFKLVLSSAQGDEKGRTEAKKTLWWVVIGAAITVGASALAKAVVNFAQKLN